jgi:hypothetical protein
MHSYPNSKQVFLLVITSAVKMQNAAAIFLFIAFKRPRSISLTKVFDEGDFPLFFFYIIQTFRRNGRQKLSWLTPQHCHKDRPLADKKYVCNSGHAYTYIVRKNKYRRITNLTSIVSGDTKDTCPLADKLSINYIHWNIETIKYLIFNIIKLEIHNM